MEGPATEGGGVRPVRAAAAAIVTVALASVTGCAATSAPTAAPTVITVVEREPVDVAKIAVPAPPPAVDLADLTLIDPKHVVAGLPGLGDRTQLENEDASLGRWRTARVVRDTAAYDEPYGAPVGMLPERTFAVPTVVPVVEVAPGWVRVMVAARGALPSSDASRVNERTAWVRAADTAPGGTDWRITVDTAGQTMTVDDGTGPVTYPVIATGSPARPTPAGPQFVVGTFWEDPGSVTPRVVLLSSQSETLDDYDRATGTSATAIHTTTLASGGEISNGCVRVADEVLDVLWHAVPPGTLVLVD
jgi:hypothetical protein